MARAPASSALPVAPHAAEEQAEIGQHADGSGDGGGNGHNQGVPVHYVGQLVRHDPFDFLGRKPPEQSGGGGDRCVRRIAAGGEGVGLIAVHDEHAGRRHAGTAREPGDDGGEARRAGGIHLARSDHGQHHAVGIPIGEGVHGHGRHKGDGHAAPPPDQPADGQEQRGEDGEQCGGANEVHGAGPCGRDL